MHFLKIINFYFLNIYCLSLFGGEVGSFSFKKKKNIEIFNFFKNEENIIFFEEVENDIVKVEFSQEWIMSFKKQRTKELELMFQEKRALQSILLENGIVRTSKNIQNIRLALESYEKTIPKREEEEKLNFENFVSLYENNLQALVEEIKNTRSRLCGISY